jgi:hypothetical protein
MTQALYADMNNKRKQTKKEFCFDHCCVAETERSQISCTHRHTEVKWLIQDSNPSNLKD